MGEDAPMQNDYISNPANKYPRVFPEVEFTSTFTPPPISTSELRLTERKINDRAVIAFDIQPGDRGWIYPAGGGTRCKAYDSTATPKYWWMPSKPVGADFYHAPDLPEAIKSAGNVCWMASGEADVWALYSAGIEHVFSALCGEGSIPGHFRAWLRSMGVVVVYIAPDRDQAGENWARKVAASLDNSGIELDIRRLPGELGSKNDIGKVWQSFTGPGYFERYLLGLPRVEAKPLPQKSTTAVSKSRNKDDIPAEYRQMVTTALHVDAFGADGFSRDNVSCPFHDDQHPSASLNEQKGLYCHVCGDWFSWQNTGVKLGLPTLREWRLSQVDRAHTYSLSTETREALVEAKLTNTARLLDGLYLAGLRPGEHFTIQQASELTGLSFYVIWQVVTNNSFAFFHPYLLTAYLPEDLQNNSRGRKAKRYLLPGPAEVAKIIGVSAKWQHSDDLPREAIGNGKQYRAEVYAALPRRRPGVYSRRTLAKRVGVSTRTAQDYDKLAGLRVEARTERHELTHPEVEALPEKRAEAPSRVWLEDTRGRKYPPTLQGASVALYWGGHVFSVEQLANHYSGGDRDGSPG